MDQHFIAPLEEQFIALGCDWRPLDRFLRPETFTTKEKQPYPGSQKGTAVLGAQQTAVLVAPNPDPGLRNLAVRSHLVRTVRTGILGAGR